MAGVDAKGGQIAIHGWQETAGDYLEWARHFEGLGAGSLLYTNVDVEGLQQGVRFEPVRHLIDHYTFRSLLQGGYRHDWILPAAGCRGVRSSTRICPV